MTALCGGGASQPLPGVGAQVDVTASALVGFLTPLIDPVTAELLAPVLATLLQIDVASFCSTDPPPDPGLTLPDVFDAIAVPPSGTSFASQTKILNWFKSRYWYNLCECSGSTATPPPPALSNPGPATQNPGLPSSGLQPPCWTASTSVTIAPGTGTSATFEIDLGQQLFNAAWLSPVTTGCAWEHWGLNANFPTINKWTLSATVDANPPDSSAVGVSTTTPAGGGTCGGHQWLTFPNVLTHATTQSVTNAQSANPLSSTMTISVDNEDTVEHTITVTLELFCPNPNAPFGPCCPPDPLLEGLLNQIMQLLTAVYQSLPAPLTSYADGPAHAVTGTGTVALHAGTIAFRVNLTTVPPHYGATMGTPNYYFDLGWVTPAALSEPFAQQRVAIDGQVFVVPAVATEVFYTLNAGVAVTITELVRGP